MRTLKGAEITFKFLDPAAMHANAGLVRCVLGWEHGVDQKRG
jgi:hypothetical protein